MSSDVERAWRPRIYRAWNMYDGRFYWAVTHPRRNAWTGQTLSSARFLERMAIDFARRLNRAERQQRMGTKS